MRGRGGGPAEPTTSWAQLVERARATLELEALRPPPGEVDLEDFAARLGAARGLTIHLYPVDLGAAAREMCGLCLVNEGSAHVFYAGAASDLSRRHNLAHELGHLLFGHRAKAPVYRPSLTTSLTTSQQRMAAWMGTDPTYGARDEAEADALGAALLGNGPGRRSHRWMATGEVRAAARQFASAFT